MRITPEEKEVFITSLSPYISGAAELFLFGSRTNDNERGGDMDLLMVVDNDANKSKLATHKIDILVDMKTRLGDQKIDLLLTTKVGITESAFLQTILPTAVSLKKW